MIRINTKRNEKLGSKHYWRVSKGIKNRIKHTKREGDVRTEQSVASFVIHSLFPSTLVSPFTICYSFSRFNDPFPKEDKSGEKPIFSTCSPPIHRPPRNWPNRSSTVERWVPAEPPLHWRLRVFSVCPP
ncbi:hypothetical protein TNIN_152801 [Trichonephila inaurata madagascariensis]|uniref:Uncharacterized protein n=1 Tax=Trichonephila inaurata madagascariensis TaxID=2747483 RepID=A0A8X6IDC5_9ARAC|nr:hypothetical protein TNIN_152801 [Trichonephila inaurata madagascariensis]